MQLLINIMLYLYLIISNTFLFQIKIKKMNIIIQFKKYNLMPHKSFFEKGNVFSSQLIKSASKQKKVKNSLTFQKIIFKNKMNNKI